VPYVSLHGYRYVVVFVDQYSRLSFAYCLRSKRDSTAALKQYIADIKHLGITIGTIYSDRGSEFFRQGPASSAADGSADSQDTAGVLTVSARGGWTPSWGQLLPSGP
jgi:transposase InsO family protein